jgi:hypothetical protein
LEDLEEKPFKTAKIQNEYIYIDSFEQLFSSIQALNSKRACQIG